jgi:hypothetical protein
MALPSVTITQADGALGLVGEKTEANTLLVGISTTGPTNAVYTYEGGDAIAQIITDFGYGPLVEAAAYHLSKSGAKVGLIRAVVNTAGTSTVPALTGTSATLTLTGAPSDNYDIKVLVTTSGTLSGVKFKYSLDNANTYSGEIALNSATQYSPANTGLTLNFAAGNYYADDYWTSTALCGSYTSTELATALTSANQSTFDFSLVHVIGRPYGTNDATKCTAYQLIVAAADTALDTAASTYYKYARAVCDAPTLTDSSAGDAAAEAAFVATDAPKAGASLGQNRILSAMGNGRYLKRSPAWQFIARARQVPVHKNPGHVALGSLGADILTDSLELDASVRSSAHSARFITMRTYRKKQGYFITDSPSMAANGSDYKNLERGRVIDKACGIAYAKLVDYINADIRVKSALTHPDEPSNVGKIIEQEAQAIETVLDDALSAMVSAGNCPAVSAQVNRTTNIVTSEELRVKVRVSPNGKASQIYADIGFALK